MKRILRNEYRFYQFSLSEIIVPRRIITRQTMKVGEGNVALTTLSYQVDSCIERSKCNTHITRMNCDAFIICAKYRMHSIITLQRRTSAPRISFVAWHCSIVEVSATRALHNVSSHRSHIPQLR